MLDSKSVLQDGSYTYTCIHTHIHVTRPAYIHIYIIQYMQVLEDRSTEERSYLFNIIKQDGIDHSYIMSDLVCTYIYTCFRRFLVCYFPIYIIMYIIQEAITSQPIQYIGACARKPSQERTSQNNAPSRSHDHVYLYTHICT